MKCVMFKKCVYIIIKIKSNGDFVLLLALIVC